MKKFFSIFSVMAVVIAAMSFVSCSKDSDDPIVDEPKPESSKSVHYSLRVVEEYFDYADIVVTFTIDGKDETVSFQKDEAVKKSTASGKMSDFMKNPKGPIRVLEGSVFYNKSLKITPNFVLTEEGKKKVEATTDESVQIDVVISDTYNGIEDNRSFDGTHIKDFEGFLKVLNDGYYNHSAL